MNLYLISQDKNNDYDTYDYALVVAPDKETARRIYPSYSLDYIDDRVRILPLDQNDFSYNKKFLPWCENDDDIDVSWNWHSWVMNVYDVDVKLIGTTELYDVPQVICASFNAG